MDDKTSTSTTKIDRLDSFHPECNELKQQYDQCFNIWFTEQYMNGHYENDECRKLFEVYTDCVKRGMKEYGLQYEQVSNFNLEINTEEEPIQTDTEESKEDQHLHELDKSLDLELEKLKKKVEERDEIMKALHRYNDIKDATQEVLGRLAILEGVTVAEMHRKYNLQETD